MKVCASVVPLPSSGTVYPCWAGTLRFEIGASEAASNCRSSSDSTSGCRAERRPARVPAPSPDRRGRERPIRIRSHIHYLLRLAAPGHRTPDAFQRYEDGPDGDFSSIGCEDWPA